MAKVTGQQTGERLNRRFSSDMGIYFREWRGKTVVASKPKKKTPKLSERNQVSVQKFKDAAVLAKNAAPSQQIAADHLTKGTQYFARDLIYMAMYGTLATIELDDGRKLFSVAANQNVSELIDALAQRVGEMLFRNVDGWEPIPVGPDNYVLTLVDGRPMWQPAQGGGGGGLMTGLNQFGAVMGRSTGIAQAYGQPFIPRARLLLHDYSAILQPNLTGWSGGAFLLRLETDQPDSPIAEFIDLQEPTDIPNGMMTRLETAFVDPIELSPNFCYVAGIARPAGAPTPRPNIGLWNEGISVISWNTPVNLPPRLLAWSAGNFNVAQSRTSESANWGAAYISASIAPDEA